MSKHLNDLSAVYLSQIAEEKKCNATAEGTDCPEHGDKACPTVEEDCGCEHEMKDKKKKKVVEGAAALPVAKMTVQAGNKDFRASTEKDANKREKLETQARTIRTTVDMDAFKKRKGVRTEGFSNWRNDLIEVVGADIPSSQAQKDTEMKTEIGEKKVRNKVVINPPLGEEIKAMGGTILEMMEYDDEFDYILESVYDELIEEGFSEDEVEFGIESALTTLDEGYYDSATETSKSNAANVKTTQFTAKKKTQGSIKDRLKSAAKKAIVGAGRAAARAANTADAVKSAPGRAAKKVSSAVARVKGLAKSGYESERKRPKAVSGTYSGAGVGRKEKIGEDVEQVKEDAKYDRNRKRAAQRAAARNAARDAGKTGAVPGVGYVTPRREKETYVDSAGVTRHKSGAKNEEVENIEEVLSGERYKKIMNKPGGTAYSRKVSADPSKRATRGGRGGESDFGAGDRGSGNRARRRAGTYQEYVEDVEQVDEKLNLKKADMGDVVKDFYKSDAPQFKGKSKEKRRQMAVAAKLTAERGGKKLGEERKPEVEAQGEKVAEYEKADKYKGIVARFRKENPGSRQPKKVRGAKPTEGELTQQRIRTANKRISKYGLTSREKKETQARAKYDSPRD